VRDYIFFAASPATNVKPLGGICDLRLPLHI